MNNKWWILSLLFLILLPLTAQSGSAGELYYRGLSPLLLGKGLDITAQDSPQNGGVNPAAPAYYQRYILDLNYINYSNFSDGSMGHGINAALSAPSKYGVVTTALHYHQLNSLGDVSLNYGSALQGDFIFSKDLYDDLFFGLALHGAYGFAGDWGATISTGVIYMPGDLGALKNVSLAAVLSQVGKSYGTESGGFMSAFPENITPMAGISFDLVDKEKAQLRMYGTLSLPTVTDLKLDTGLSMYMGPSMNLNTAVSADLLDLINGDMETLIPGFSMNINLPLTPRSKIGNKLQTSELNLQGGGALLYDNVLAIGAGVTLPFGVRDKNAPEVEIEYPEVQTISPNYDGTQDELDLPLFVDESRYIKGYTITVYDDDGNPVRRFYNKDARPENSSFNSLFQRLKTPRQSIPVPESFRWDGLTEQGEMAPDGDYSFIIDIWDDNDNHQITEATNFSIDGTKPELTLEQPLGAELIFSPDGDGRKDSFLLPQSGSPESSWTGEIVNQDGVVVKTFSWEETAPEAVYWDGTDDEGEVLADGVYQYRVSATDAGGNKAEDSLNNILINTAQPEVKLTIDHSHFSPGNSQARDRIRIGLDLSTLNGLAEWRLDIVNASGEVQKSWTQGADEQMLIDGALIYRGETDRSGFLQEGRYQARFTGRYQNGFAPEIYSPQFVADKTAPSVRISITPRIFSPDGDGQKDEVIFTQDTSEEEEWKAVILNEAGVAVQEWLWKGLAPEEWNWNGQDRDGKIRSVQAPQTYRYYMEATDLAGNSTRSEEMPFVYDNSQVEFLLSVDQSAFSPNGDGIKDRLTFTMEQVGATPVNSHSLTLLDRNNREVLTLSEGDSPRSNLVWDGGSIQDGTYKAQMVISYTNGKTLQVTSPEFLIDRIYPEIRLEHSPLLISPNGDGRRDSLELTQVSSEEELFEAQIENRSGEVLAEWFWQGQLEDLQWNGQDQSGNILADGTYLYRVQSQDKAGNRTERLVEGIQVDNQKAEVFLTVDLEVFSPAGREEFRSQNLSFFTGLKEGISSWTLNLEHQEQGVIKSWSGSNSAPPENFSWDGLSDSDRLIEGEYIARATVEYEKGDRPVAESLSFVLDSSAPEVNLRLEPLPFSPDADNVDDELMLSMAVRDLSPIESWHMSITDPRNKEFISFSGQGKPTQRIIWDGRSNKGELVQSAEDYRFALTVTDIMGNSNTQEGDIPVDVLVVRDGDKLKILISNIEFQPNLPDLTGDTKNMEVLERIAEILDKYNRYRIVVEGHANPFEGTQEEKTELKTLSEERAKVVMDILIDLGVDSDRLGFIGKGGEATMADPRNRDENWRNRRVEFILEK